MDKKDKDLRKAIAKLEIELQALIQENDEINYELESLLTKESIESATENLYAFYTQAWQSFETVPFIGNWHLECICEHLQALVSGEIQDLIIQCPPRMSKSSIINVCFPVWYWIQDPKTKFITVSHGDSLAIRDSNRSRELISSPWFQRHWGDRFKLKSGVNQKSRYENNSNGYRIATSITGKAVGEGFDCQTPYTKILTNKGAITIEDLYNRQDPSIEIFCYDTKNEVVQCLKPFRYLRNNLRDRSIVRITFTDGSYTDCTADHKWYTSEYGYIKAEDLISWQDNRQLPNKPLSILSWEVTRTGQNTIYKEVEKVQVLNSSEFTSSYFVYTLSMPPHGNYFVVPEGSNYAVLAKNCLIVDDPIKPAEINSKVALENVIEWWRNTISTRRNSPDSRRVVMHQRLSDLDLIGYILDNDEGLWENISLPMEYEPKVFVSSIGWQDPRTEEGELLWKDRFSRDAVEKLKKDLGTYGYASQYQQRPAAKEGGIIKKDWIKYYGQPFNDYTLKNFDLVIQSWDLAFGDTGDFTVGQVWGRKGPDKFLLDQVRGKWTFTEQLTKIRQLRSVWPQTRTILIENKANGAAVIDTLRRSISGLIPINPKEIGGGDKEVRLSACALDFEAGNVWFPSNNFSSFTNDLVGELTVFPRAAHDDQCDALSQALNWFATKAGNYIAIIPTEQGLDNIGRIAPRKGQGTMYAHQKTPTSNFAEASRRVTEQNTVSSIKKIFD